MNRNGWTYEDDFKQHLLIDLHELLVPLFDIGGLLASVGIIILCLEGVVAVVVAPLNHLAKNGLVHLKNYMSVAKKSSTDGSTYVGDRNRVFSIDALITDVFQHVLDQHGSFGNNAVC
jgi:hypothetical protein